MGKVLGAQRPPNERFRIWLFARRRLLLRAGTELSLAEIAARASVSDQSARCQHFKRLVGVTPGRFRMRIRIS